MKLLTNDVLRSLLARHFSFHKPAHAALGLLAVFTFIAALHLIFRRFFLVFFRFFLHRVSVVYVSFCSLIKGITPKICMLCFVLIKSFFFFFFCGSFIYLIQ